MKSPGARKIFATVLLLACPWLASGLLAAPAMAASTELVSVVYADNTVIQGNDWSGSEANYKSATVVTPDGRYVAFASLASNLVPGDNNGVPDIFVHDRWFRTTRRASIATDNTEANGQSAHPSISPDGRYVAFQSLAGNLVPGDTNGTWDIFVRDLWTGTTERASLSSSGGQGAYESMNPSISADGRYVAFLGDNRNYFGGNSYAPYDIYVRDRALGTTTLASQGTSGVCCWGGSNYPAISADGNFVAYSTYGSNIIVPDTNGTIHDIIVYSRLTGTSEFASVDSFGVQGNNHSEFPELSADGTFVAFESAASNLVAGDNNGLWDVFLRNRLTGVTELISVGAGGSPANGNSRTAGVSADGRYVVFYSEASNLGPPGGQHVFLRDRLAGTTELVSVSSDGTPGNGVSAYVLSAPTVSGDGRVAAFASEAFNLVPSDWNWRMDVFARVRDLDRDADGYNEQVDCNDNNALVHPGATEIPFDGIDQDCNGYDLTIAITKAEYSNRRHTLSVNATSSRGSGAGLQLAGYGPMTWSNGQQRWTITVSGVGANPGTVTVSGAEGSVSGPTTVVR